MSRIRSSYNENQKEHFCILRKVQKLPEENKADFEYRERKQKLFINDLQRVGINVLLVDRYEEVTEILREVEQTQNVKPSLSQVQQKIILLTLNKTLKNLFLLFLKRF